MSVNYLVFHPNNVKQIDTIAFTHVTMYVIQMFIFSSSVQSMILRSYNFPSVVVVVIVEYGL